MKQKNINISIVSPEYKGEKMVPELVSRIVASVSPITDNFEIILVNDASPDNTWNEIEKACAKDKRVKGLNLSRNFGQHYAITAGLNYAKGDWVVVMDCDLQDRPEEIPNLYKKAQEGFDIVQARRVVKRVGWWKRFSSMAFHVVFDWLSGSKSDPAIGNFGIYNRKSIDAFNQIPQQARSFESIMNLVGFKRGSIVVEQAESERGGSSYTLAKLLKLSFDVMITNSNKPLRMAVGLGFCMSFISFLLALYNLLAKIIGIIQVEGFTTTIFSIWFVGGLMLFVLGVLGLYIGKIFDQVKGHPLFVVRDFLNFD